MFCLEHWIAVHETARSVAHSMGVPDLADLTDTLSVRGIGCQHGDLLAGLPEFAVHVISLAASSEPSMQP